MGNVLRVSTFYKHWQKLHPLYILKRRRVCGRNRWGRCYYYHILYQFLYRILDLPLMYLLLKIKIGYHLYMLFCLFEWFVQPLVSTFHLVMFFFHCSHIFFPTFILLFDAKCIFFSASIKYTMETDATFCTFFSSQQLSTWQTLISFSIIYFGAN